MSKEKLLSALNESESVKSEKNTDDVRTKQIREDFNELRDWFLKPKTEVRRNLYEIESKKNLSKSKIKKIEKNILQLEKSFSKLKKYYDYDKIEYKGIRDVGHLFNQSTDKDYHKLIKTINVFDNKNNYIEWGWRQNFISYRVS